MQPMPTTRATPFAVSLEEVLSGTAAVMPPARRLLRRRRPPRLT